MPVVDVVNLDGKKVGQVELADAIFGAQVNQHLLDKLNQRNSALVVAHGENSNWERASRNVQGVTLSAPSGLQPYDVLKHDLLLLSKDAVMRLSHSLDPEKRPVVVPDVETIAPAAKPVKKETGPKAAAHKPHAAKN